MKIKKTYYELDQLIETIIDNRGKTVPTAKTGIPLIATNCIKQSSIYPTFENLRYINQKTYNNWFRSHLKPNDILFVNKGTPGRTCITPNPVNFVAAQDMVGIRFKSEFNPFYMLAVFRSNEIQQIIKNNHVGLVIAHYRKQELLKLKLPILEKDIRDFIGKLYFVLSQKIEINNKINLELEKIAKTIYYYWFVQFDFPDKNGKPYKSSGGKMIWVDCLKQQVPDNWQVRKLINVSNTIVRGISPIYVESGGMCVLNQKCIRNKVISYNFSRRHNNIQKNVGLKLIQYEDVLINSTGFGTLGRVAIVKRLPENEITFDSHITMLRHDPKKVEKLYFAYSLLMKEKEIEKMAEGSTGQTELSRASLENMQIIIPKFEIQQDFSNYIAPLLKKIANNEAENEVLISLRDWLLPKLMNGQVKVEN